MLLGIRALLARRSPGAAVGLTRNADLFRTLVGRGVGLVFCDLPHVLASPIAAR